MQLETYSIISRLSQEMEDRIAENVYWGRSSSSDDTNTAFRC